MFFHYPVSADDTFKEEVDFFMNYLPEALDLKDSVRISEILDKEFVDTLDTSFLSTTQLSGEFQEKLFEPSQTQETLFRDQWSESEEAAWNSARVLRDKAISSTIPYKTVQALYTSIGSKAFAFYLPMHEYFGNSKYGWGIYLLPEIFGPKIHALYQPYKHDVDYTDFVNLFIWCIYRQQLFYYQVESFATGHEVLMRRAYYINYQKCVYLKSKKTADCLEDALSGRAVLDSRLVGNKARFESKVWKKMYSEFLAHMPYSYPNFNYNPFHSSDEAHSYLAAQIIHGRNVTPLPTSINTVKREYIQNDKKVPVYMITGFDVVSRLR